MKKLILWSYSIVIISMFGCQKIDLKDPQQSKTLNIEEAKTFFYSNVNPASDSILKSNEKSNQNPRSRIVHVPLWDKAISFKFSFGDALIIPVHFDSIQEIQTTFSGKKSFMANDLTQLVIYKDSTKQYHADMVTFMPDENYIPIKGSPFTGIVIIEDWQGNFLKSYKCENNRRFPVSLNNNKGSSEKIQALQVCYTYYWTNYSPVNDEYTYFSEPGGCYYYYYDDGLNYSSNNYDAMFRGTSGIGGIPSSKSFSIFNGNNPIGNLADYMKCFDNIQGNTNTYQVTICINQPSAGSRTPWSLSGTNTLSSNNPFNVGHAFMVFQQVSPSKTIIRNIGFYPQSTVTPLTPVSPGMYNNDGGTDYNISLTLAITSSQFFSMMNFIAQTSSIPYNLNSNNCTTFVINAFATAGINLPMTKGTWSGGSGFDPGDLGEDIRGMDLQPNMTRNSSSASHPNQGSCQ